MSDTYTIAYKLMTLGFSVIPSGGGEKDKLPLVNWRDYQITAPDERQLKDWQKRIRPKLWGIVTNGRIAVINADTPKTRAKLEAGRPKGAKDKRKRKTVGYFLRYASPELRQKYGK